MRDERHPVWQECFTEPLLLAGNAYPAEIIT